MFKQRKAYEVMSNRVGSEKCIRGSIRPYARELSGAWFGKGEVSREGFGDQGGGGIMDDSSDDEGMFVMLGGDGRVFGTGDNIDNIDNIGHFLTPSFGSLTMSAIGRV